MLLLLLLLLLRRPVGSMGRRLKEVFGSKVAFGLEGGYNLQVGHVRFLYCRASSDCVSTQKLVCTAVVPAAQLDIKDPFRVIFSSFCCESDPVSTLHEEW